MDSKFSRKEVNYMKKIIILALAFIFAASVSFAGTKNNNKAAGMEMTGRVKTVIMANPSKGTKSEIIVMDDKAKESVFEVKSTTTIYGPDFKAISLDKLKADEKVMVKYTTTKKGIHEAVSINLKS
jgi:hypothetical protein